MDETSLNSKIIELIADSLANFHDWDVPNLKTEFINVILNEELEMNPKVPELIFDEFMKIDLKKRFGVDFDHINFVKQIITQKENYKDFK